MDSVRFLPQFSRAVRSLTAAFCLGLAGSSMARATDCIPLGGVVAHLAPLAPTGTPSLAARPGDILNYLEELPAPQRAQFRELITAAREQDPHLRGLETYERVLFTAVQTDSDPQALKATLIPVGQGRENVVTEMIRHLESHPACHSWSICGRQGSELLTRMMRLRLNNPRLREALPGITENLELIQQVTALQDALLQRLRAAHEAGEWRYEDSIRLSVEYANLNSINFDVRQLLRPGFWDHGAPHQPPDWAGILSALQRAPGQVQMGTESTVKSLLNDASLQKAVVTLSTRPFGEVEIAPPGFMVTNLELPSSPSFADGFPMLLSAYLHHDNNHRKTLATKIEAPLHNLAYQLSRLREWAPFATLRAELRTHHPEMVAKLDSYILDEWHENARSIQFFSYYLQLQRQNHDLVAVIENHLPTARQLESAFLRLLTPELKKLRTPAARLRAAFGYFGPILKEVTNTGMNEREAWNAFIAHASSPAMQDRPLQRRLIELFVSHTEPSPRGEP